MGAGTRGVGLPPNRHDTGGDPGQQSPDTGETTFLSLHDLYPKGQGPFPAKSPANVSGNWAPIGPACILVPLSGDFLRWSAQVGLRSPTVLVRTIRPALALPP